MEPFSAGLWPVNVMAVMAVRAACRRTMVRRRPHTARCDVVAGVARLCLKIVHGHPDDCDSSDQDRPRDRNPLDGDEAILGVEEPANQ